MRCLKYILSFSFITVGIFLFASCNLKEPEKPLVEKVENSRGVRSYKSYECSKISHADYEEFENWIPAPQHNRDSIVVLDERAINLIYNDGNQTEYKIVKYNGFVPGRPSGIEAVSYLCKDLLNNDTEIIFEANTIKQTFVIVVFKKDSVYQYKIQTSIP